MRIERTPDLTAEQKEIITRLWNAEYPENINYAGAAEFEEFLNKQTNRQHFLLFDENENLKGWLMTFTRDGERWFSVIIDGTDQKKGYGTTLLNEVKRFESEIHGWVVAHDDYLKSNGETYLSPIGFYLKNGFEVLNDVRLETETMSAVKIKWTK